MSRRLCSLLFGLLLPLAFSCSHAPAEKHLTVAATSVPHAQMLEQVKDELHAQGICLQILIIDDYNLPNRALAEGEVDANFFQHTPFLEAQVHSFAYPLRSLAKIHIEPMGLYAPSLSSIGSLQEGASIAIPNDPTNEHRALLLLQAEGLITLNQKAETLLDITSNPKRLRIQEIDAAMLARTLQDVALAAIPTNFALQAGLTPSRALVLEQGSSAYANILVVREGEENRKELAALATSLTSEKMRRFILETYHNALLPSF